MENIRSKPNKKLMLVIVLSMILMSSFVFAAPGSNKSKSGKKKTKVLRFDSLTVSGESAKPSVFYLLNRKKIQIRHEPIKHDLLQELEKTVEGDPF